MYVYENTSSKVRILIMVLKDLNASTEKEEKMSRKSGLHLERVKKHKHFFRVVCRYRSSNQRCSVSKGVVRNFAKFSGKHLCQSLFFNKFAGLRKFYENVLYRTPPGDCFFIDAFRTLSNIYDRKIVID